MTNLEWALLYAELGWPVFPCHTIDADGKCSCLQDCGSDAGKHPRTLKGVKNATLDRKQIEKWWRMWPDSNIAIATGGDFGVVDVDAGDGGLKTARGLIKEGKLPPSLQANTGGGGCHIFYKKAPEKRLRNRVRILPGIDLRGEGGYVIAPPSRHRSGNTYSWTEPPDQSDLEEIPDWVFSTGSKNGKNGKNGKAPLSVPEEIPDGQRGDLLFKIACSFRAKGISYQAAEAALREENQLKCKPPKEEKDLQKILESAYSRYEAGSMEGGEKKPKGLKLLLWEKHDHEGHAQCVRELYGKRFLWCKSYDWLYYTGRYWEREGASQTLDRKIVDTLRKRREMGVQEGNEDLIKATKAHKTNVGGAKYLFTSLNLTSVDEFNRHPDLLNCRNGVLNLKTGELIPHSHEQRFTYCLPVKYDPDAYSSLWMEFLRNTLSGDQEMIDYLQIALGYSLTGHTREEIMFYIYGPQRSGKGTFTECLLKLLGRPLSVEADFTTFTALRDGESQNFDLAPLQPCRFVAASESNRHTSLNPAKIKALTGGNYVRCAFKHKDHFEYRPQFKIWLSSNHKLNVDVDDDAAWGRVHVIPFPNSMKGRENKKLKGTLKKKAHLQAILNWAVKGARKWYDLEQGIKAPTRVERETEKHRDDLDYIREFIDEYYKKTDSEEDFQKAKDVYQKYENWCEENGLKPKFINQFSISMESKGFSAKRKYYSREGTHRSFCFLKALSYEEKVAKI